jgi:hypothetical protein
VGRRPSGARAANLRNVVSPIASSTSPRPTKSSKKFVPEDSVAAADVAKSLRPGAQDASDRSARVVSFCTEGVVRVRLFVACTGSRLAVESERARAAGSDGLEAGVEVTVAVTIVELTVDSRAAGAGSGRIEARAGEGEGSGPSGPWAVARPVTPPKTIPQASRLIPCRSLFESIPTIRPPQSRRDLDTVLHHSRKRPPL